MLPCLLMLIHTGVCDCVPKSLLPTAMSQPQFRAVWSEVHQESACVLFHVPHDRLWLTVCKRTKVCRWRRSASGGLGRHIGWQRQAEQGRALMVRHLALLAMHSLHLFPSLTEETLKCAFEAWFRWRDSGCAVIKDLWLCLPPQGAGEHELSSYAGRGPEEEAQGVRLILIPFSH